MPNSRKNYIMLIVPLFSTVESGSKDTTKYGSIPTGSAALVVDQFFMPSPSSSHNKAILVVTLFWASNNVVF